MGGICLQWSSQSLFLVSCKNLLLTWYVIISTSFEATTPDFHFSTKVIILSLFAMASTPKWLNYMCSIMSVGIGQNYTLLLVLLYIYWNVVMEIGYITEALQCP